MTRLDRAIAVKTAAVLAFACIGTALAAVASAAEPPGTTYEEILAGAKKEGKLVAWIAAPRNPATHKALIDAFNAKFGLTTRIEWVPNSAVTSNTRAITEAAGGAVSVDVIGAGALEEVSVAAKANLIKPYPWGQVFGKAFPVLNDMSQRVIPEYRAMALPYQVVAYGLAWNPDSIKEADLPQKFTDLGDPKFQGKFGFNAFLAPLEIVSYVIGADATIDTAKKIFANKPVFERGTPAVARSVVTGAVPFGVTVSAVAETSERVGEPLKFRLFSDVIPLSQVYVYVPENSPNPNTARLFAAWLVAEGSAVGDKIEPMVRPGDPDSKLGHMISASQEKTGAKVAEVTKFEQIEATAKLREQLGLLLSGQAK